jgi:hypothetical protein
MLLLVTVVTNRLDHKVFLRYLNVPPVRNREQIYVIIARFVFPSFLLLGQWTNFHDLSCESCVLVVTTTL